MGYPFAIVGLEPDCFLALDGHFPEPANCSGLSNSPAYNPHKMGNSLLSIGLVEQIRYKVYYSSECMDFTT